MIKHRQGWSCWNLNNHQPSLRVLLKESANVGDGKPPLAFVQIRSGQTDPHLDSVFACSNAGGSLWVGRRASLQCGPFCIIQL